MSNYPLDFLGGLEGLKVFVRKLSKALEKYQEWYQNNAETISSYIEFFSEVVEFSQWRIAVERLKEEQIIFTNDLTLELIGKINQSDNVGLLIQTYYFENDDSRMKEVIARCRISYMVSEYANFYHEIESAYENQYYQLTCAGLFALTDGILSTIVSDPCNIDFDKRTKKLEEQIKNKIQLSQRDRKLCCIFKILDPIVLTMFGGGKKSFLEVETDALNRNRVQHGRTHRQYTKFDVLKAWLYLDAILFLSDVDNTELSAEE